MIQGFPFFVKVSPEMYAGKPNWTGGRHYPVLATEESFGGSARVLVADNNGRIETLLPKQYSVSVIVCPKVEPPKATYKGKEIGPGNEPRP